MAFHVGRQLPLLLSLMLLLLQLTQARPKGNNGNNNEEDGDDDDSSSEETVEDSVEPGRRKRDVSSSIGGGRAGIPGLPDPATIIKIAQLFQSVGEQIVPILLEAVLPAGEATGDRITRKRSLESASLELQRIFK